MAAAAVAQGAAAQNCPVPSAARNVALPDGVPPALRSVLGDIALPGEPFDPSDVIVKGHKYRRYIFVWNLGDRWIVALEQGGIALRSEVFAYKLGKDGQTAALIDKSNGVTNNVCKAATKLAGR